jgi:hypothetical protein
MEGWHPLVVTLRQPVVIDREFLRKLNLTQCGPGSPDLRASRLAPRD